MPKLKHADEGWKLKRENNQVKSKMVLHVHTKICNNFYKLTDNVSLTYTLSILYSKEYQPCGYDPVYKTGFRWLNPHLKLRIY